VKKACFLAVLIFCYSLTVYGEDTEVKGRILDIGKIVITPSKVEQQYSDLPQNVSVIEGDAIESSGAAAATEALNRLPSLNIVNYGAAGATKTIHSRGFSDSQVLVLVDGIPAHTPRDGTADLNKLDLDNVEKIEVLRGPASSIYGSGAMGGVINIITKDGRSFPKTMCKAEYGFHDTRGINFAHGRNLDIWDYYFSHDTYKTNGHRSNSDYECHTTNLKLGYTPWKDNRLVFSYGYHQSELGVLGPDYWQDTDDRQESWRQDISLTWDADITEDANILLKGYHNIDRLEFIENLACTDLDAHKSKIGGVELQYAQKILDRVRLTAGYNRQDFRLDSSASGKHKSFLNAAYFEGEVDILEEVKLFLGARYDNYSNFGDRFSPSSRFSWWLNDNFKFHGLYSQAFRAPTYNDLYWPREDWGIWGGVEGNELLGPEKSESYEVGISTYFLEAIWTDLTFFRNRVEDLIIWNEDSSSWHRPENMAQAIIRGVELNSDFMLWKRLKTNLNYSYLYAKDKNTKNYLIYRPQHQYKLNLDYKTENGWDIDCGFRYVSKRFTIEDNTNTLSPYWVVDTSISKELWDIWELRLSGKNIFDRDYREIQGYPLPGRQITTSLKCEF
jgi:outer membrane cobalamin receptor